MGDVARGPYGTISADPPWPEYGGGGRGAQNHYQLLSLSDIAKTMISAPCWRPADDSHLWIWTTMSNLPGGLSLLDELGFRYVTHFAWVKVHDDTLQIGLGRYLRGAHELCLLGTRGAAMVPAKAPPSVVLARRTKHSAKPAEAYRLIEQVSPGPRLEMFARTPRDGWDVWGNEVPT